jgi:hypothetical protein
MSLRCCFPSRRQLTLKSVISRHSLNASLRESYKSEPMRFFRACHGFSPSLRPFGDRQNKKRDGILNR